MLLEDFADLAHFKGIARLFPLPNLVLFPCMMQALHIFEPRYRELTADALADDRFIALALLRPGWEADYQGRPELHSVACLGKIVTDQRLEDGRYNLQLRGVSRIRILREVENGKLYRSAQVELLPDGALPSPQRTAELRQQFCQLVPTWCTAQGPALEVFTKILHSNLPLGMITDIISFTLPLESKLQQEMLEQPDVEQRACQLIDVLQQYAPVKFEAVEDEDRKFPPDFSTN